MIYTEMTKKALQISFDAHKEHVDKAGLPYVFHPFHLAEQMDDEVSVCAALLHDVVEDTDITFEDLLQSGISQEVIDILKLLTHDAGTPYMGYVCKIKESNNPHAIAVKLADLLHNADLARLSIVDDEALARIEKYKKAIAILTNQKTECGT